MLLLTLIMVFFLALNTYGTDFVKGADISWVTGQEKIGIVFKDTLGRTRDILDILKNDYQLNTIRLRVFVNPSDSVGDGLCDIASTVGMARRIEQNGMKLMLTLHYSDSWADPGKQNPPAEWKNLNADQLETAVYNHTKEVMEALSAEGIYPVLVQIGNETNNGMLWPTGEASSNMGNYARFVTSGHNAVKEISPSTQTVVHLSNGFDNSLYRWNIGGLVNNSAKFDIIGMSAYPEYAPNTSVNDWPEFNDKIYTNMNDMIESFDKPVIIAETGMHYSEEINCQDMISDLIKKLKSVDDNMGLGVLYWEPQAGPGYNRGYNLGAWDAEGKPTQALKGFVEIVSTSMPNHKPRGMININSIISSTSHGIKINLPQMYSGTRICLYQADGKLVYKNEYSTKTDIRLPLGMYFLKIGEQPIGRIIRE